MDAESESLLKLRKQMQPDFACGVSHYQQQEFSIAKEYFQKVLRLNPQDRTT